LCLLQYHYDWKTRTIPEDRRPSLTDLQIEAGYCRTTVRDHLQALELAGWITRRPPPIELARREHQRTAYELHIPGSEHHAGVRAGQADGQDAKARRERFAAYVRERQAANAATRVFPTAKVGRGRRRGARAAGLAAGDWTGDARLVGLAAAELAAANGGTAVDEAAVRDTVRLVLGGRRPRDPGQYLVTAIRREPRRFLPAPAPPRAELVRPDVDRPSDERVDAIIKEAGLRRPADSTAAKGST